MVGRLVQVVAAGGRRLAAQMTVSVAATTAAALLVPSLLSALAPATPPSAREKEAASRVLAPADFEAAFVWPVAAPPDRSADLEPPRLPAVVPLPPRPQRGLQAMAPASPAPVPTAAGMAHRACAPRCPAARPVATAPAPAPAVVQPTGAPLELAAMIAPRQTDRRTLLGLPVPSLPYEQAVVGTLVKARDAVRSLF